MYKLKIGYSTFAIVSSIYTLRVRLDVPDLVQFDVFHIEIDRLTCVDDHINKVHTFGECIPQIDVVE